jgi:hypothetical protein
MAFKTRVVVRCLDGRVLKGFTFDFLPNKESFHLVDAEDERKIEPISAKGLKAVFFVKTFAGNKSRKGGSAIRWGRGGGHRLRVTFLDGEVLHGTTTSYTPARKGFFIVPVDEGDNNERAYVFTEATREIEMIPAATSEGAGAARGVR